MAMPICWRIVSGYLLLLLFSVGLVSYSIVQLSGLGSTARAALNTDNRMIGHEEILTETFLSEARYAGRFIITHTAALHDQLRQFKDDFKRYMSELTALTESSEIEARLRRVDQLHLRYHNLFDQEVRYIRAGQPYAQSRYHQEREKILDSALRELERLRAELHGNLNHRLETMEGRARAARNLAIAGALVLIAVGLALSLLISKSITQPLSEFTRRAAEGFEEDGVSPTARWRIPEIQEISEILRYERLRLGEVAQSHREFINGISEQLAAPLHSLRDRLSFLKQKLSQTGTPEQNQSLDIIIKETECLIEHCNSLQALPGPVAAWSGGHQAVRPDDRETSLETVRIYSGSEVLNRAGHALGRAAKCGRDLLSSCAAFGQSTRLFRHGRTKRQ